MKIILDTNVLVSGIFFGGKPLEIIRAWRQKKIRFIVSHEILNEYTRIVDGLSLKFPSINASEIVNTIVSNSELTFSIALDQQVCEDPDDDKFLGAALASKTKIIVSGDKLLQKVSGWQEILVLSPAEFVRSYL